MSSSASPTAPSSPQPAQKQELNSGVDSGVANGNGVSDSSPRSSNSAISHPPTQRSIVLVVVLNTSEESKSMRKVSLAYPYTYTSLQDTVAKSLQISLSAKTLYFTYKDTANGLIGEAAKNQAAVSDTAAAASSSASSSAAAANCLVVHHSLNRVLLTSIACCVLR